MTVANFLLFALGSIGMCHIIVDGKIFEWFRELLFKIMPNYLCELFRCYQCMGFWSGLFCGYFILGYNVHPWWMAVTVTFICGCAGSALSAWAATYLNLLEAHWFNAEIEKQAAQALAKEEEK